MHRRLSIALAVAGVMVATVAAAFATNAAFSTDEDSSAAAVVSGIGTVPELTTPSTRSLRPTGASSRTDYSDHTYSVRDAGVVVLRQSDVKLSVVKVVANAGWRAEAAKTETRLGIPVVEVSFDGGDTEVIFTALLVDNAIIARDERHSGSSSGDSDDHGGGVTTPGTQHHDDDSPATTRPDSSRHEPPEPTETSEREDDEGPEPTEVPEPPEPTEVPEPPEVES